MTDTFPSPAGDAAQHPTRGPHTHPIASPVAPPVARPTWRFLCNHPAHWLALGGGSGLSPVAPGTVGTLWAWLAFAALDPWVDTAHWLAAIALGTLVGWWACTRTARDLGKADPSEVVWDEVLAFWLVLAVLTPASFTLQAIAFGVFRFFDAAKPGPVGWADQLFKARDPDHPGAPPSIGWAQGWGILFDDFVAAGCTLLTLAAGLALWRAW